MVFFVFQTQFSFHAEHDLFILIFNELNSSNMLETERSPSKKFCVICFIESPLKVMKNVFFFISKALFVHKIYLFLSRLFGHVEKAAWLER